MPNQVRYGFKGVLARNTAATYATPTWAEMKNVRGVKVAQALTEVDVTTRMSEGFKATDGTLVDIGVDFEVINVKTITGNTAQAEATVKALRDAWFAKSDIDLLVIDGPTNEPGVEGVRFVGRILKFELSQENDKEQVYAVSIKPTFSENPPVRYVVPPGSGS